MSTRAATVPPPSLPLGFFAVGLLALGFAALALASGRLVPLALFHLAALGGFAMVAFGALYQFVPVSGMRPLRGLALGYVHLVLAAVGTAAVVAGFQRADFAQVRAGGSLHVVGALLQAIVLAATLRHGTPVVTARGAALALGGFIVAAGLAIVTAGVMLAGGDARTLAAAHGTIALAGFFGTLIVAVTFRLLRMFERYSLEQRAASRGIAAGLAALIAALVPRIGYLALVAAGTLFAVDVGTVARHRNPAYQRETFGYAAVSTTAGLAAAVLALAGDDARAGIVALWLFVGTAVVGYLQRIVPFTWWIQRARREGAQRIPTLGEMNQTQLGAAILCAWSAGGIWCAIAPLARPAGVLALGAWLGLLVQLARPFALPAKRSA